MLHQLWDTVADDDDHGMGKRYDAFPFLCCLDFKVADNDDCDGTTSHVRCDTALFSLFYLTRLWDGR